MTPWLHPNLLDPCRWITVGLATAFRYDLDPSRRLLFPGPGGRHTTETYFVETPRRPIPVTLMRPRRSNGRAVVFGHGAGAQMLVPYFRLIETLIDRGVTVLAYESDGHGRNPAPFAVPSCLEVAPAVLEHLRGLPGIDRDRIGYYGMSLGAVLGLHAAAELPWVKALVLVAPPMSLTVTRWTRLKESLGTVMPTLAPVLVESSMEHMMGCFHNPVRFEDGAVHALIDPELFDYLQPAWEQMDPLGVARGLRPVPTMVVQGLWDTIAQVGESEELVRSLKGPAELFGVNGRNHFTVLFHRPAAIAAADWFVTYL